MNSFANEFENLMTEMKIADGRWWKAKFSHIDDKDGFEISLGLYRANLGPITEEVFRRFAGKFKGEVQEPEESEK